MPEITDQISTSVDALMEEFRTITHNLANVSTVGYKRRCNAFSVLLRNQPVRPEDYSPGSIAVNSAIDFSQGGFQHTGRSLDCAISGNGFFVIETPQGPLYTRNGTFLTDETGQIVDSLGRAVAGEAGAITIPTSIGPSQINISVDGTVSAGGVQIGKLRVVDFGSDRDKLVPVGNSCLQMPDEEVTAVAATDFVVKQGYLESSNVKLVEELVDMIMVTRLYQANMKAVEASGQASGSLLSAAMG